VAGDVKMSAAAIIPVANKCWDDIKSGPIW
jgi:hypothetical protein